ncbi:MAG: hypothetical protein ACJ74Q_08920, partial [Pyrinomonadaceae bacterium]
MTRARAASYHRPIVNDSHKGDGAVWRRARRTHRAGLDEALTRRGLRVMWWPRAAVWAAMLLLTAALAASGCRQVKNAAGLSVRPKSLRDVPAERLSFRFEADAKEESLPERLRHDEPEEPLPGVKT